MKKIIFLLTLILTAFSSSFSVEEPTKPKTSKKLTIGNYIKSGAYFTASAACFGLSYLSIKSSYKNYLVWEEMKSRPYYNPYGSNPYAEAQLKYAAETVKDFGRAFFNGPRRRKNATFEDCLRETKARPVNRIDDASYHQSDIIIPGFLSTLGLYLTYKGIKELRK